MYNLWELLLIYALPLALFKYQINKFIGSSIPVLLLYDESKLSELKEHLKEYVLFLYFSEISKCAQSSWRFVLYFGTSFHWQELSWSS